VDGAVGATGPHRELGDLVVEAHEALDDHPSGIDAPAAGRVVPGGLDVLRAVDLRLALAGGGHHRLDDARVADRGITVAAVDGRAQFPQAAGETVGRGRQAEFLGSQPPDALAVHRQPGRAGGRDHPRQPFTLDLHQRRRGNRLDLRHHQVGLLLLDERAQRNRIGHVDHVRAVGHLVPGCIRVAIDRDDLCAKALQRDDHFLAELAGAQQHHAGGRGTERGTECNHDADMLLAVT